jgi:cysteine desulfurase
VRPGARIHPLIGGGLQEGGKRGGAEDVPGIVALGTAARIARREMEGRAASAGWVEGEALTLALAARGVAASPGSACTVHGGKAAPALEAIGLEPPWTHSAILFTLRHTTTEAEVDHAIAAFAEVVAELRAMSPIGR